MFRIAGWVCCALLLVGGAVVHGAATHRWGFLAPDPARAEAAHAHAVHLADYAGTQVDSSLPVRENSRVTCRQYTSPSGRWPVTVSLTSGPAGAVSTHTPDVCYPGSGFVMTKSPKRESVDLPAGGTASYLVAEFEKKTPTTYERHRVRWAWTTDGTWAAPDNPRLAFGFPAARELFKLYVVTAVPFDAADKGEPDTPAVKQFVAAAFGQYAGLLAAKP